MSMIVLYSKIKLMVIFFEKTIIGSFGDIEGLCCSMLKHLI